MFITERQLVEVLKTSFSTMCDWNIEKENTLVSEEVDLGFGVADLVISKVKDVTYPSVEFNNFDIILYNTIKDNKEIDCHTITSLTHINHYQVKKSLNKLLSHEIIHSFDCKYKIRIEYEEVIHKNIAIEAKLKNWKRALNQAFRYKWFASETYVVMDSCHVHTAVKKIDEFRKLNVGLAEINVDGVLVMHYKPNEETPYNNKMMMTFNERVKSHLLSSQV